MLFLMTAAALGIVAGPNQMCREMIVPREAGTVVHEADTRPVLCSTEGLPRRLRYDARQRATRATEDLAVGDKIGRAWFAPEPAVKSGDRVQIAAQLGHVRLMRTAVALQSAYPSERFYVRSADGQVFVAPPAGAAQ